MVFDVLGNLFEVVLGRGIEGGFGGGYGEEVELPRPDPRPPPRPEGGALGVGRTTLPLPAPFDGSEEVESAGMSYAAMPTTGK